MKRYLVKHDNSNALLFEANSNFISQNKMKEVMRF